MIATLNSLFRSFCIVVTFASLTTATALVYAQDAEPNLDGMPAEQQEMIRKMLSIDWKTGPTTGNIGTMAKINVPEGYRFTEAAGAQTLLEVYGNPRNPNILAAMEPLSENETWTLIFQFDSIGYVKDEDKDALDADDLMSTFRAGIEPGNQRRRAMGAEELRSINWAEKPFYDSETNNLTWALNLAFDSGNSINYDIRVLGRRGVMEVTLIGDPETYSQAVPTVKNLLTGYSFTDGNKYSEWVPGDKVAEYGLAGLVAGGAIAAAAKTGLLSKLGLLIAKGGKAIILVFVVIGGAILSAFKRLFGGGGDDR
ncbi:MAG: DUF2167 domain-containing protein [Pirellulaceae bacterium]